MVICCIKVWYYDNIGSVHPCISALLFRETFVHFRCIYDETSKVKFTFNLNAFISSVAWKVTFQSNAILCYSIEKYLIALLMESNALRYFCVNVCLLSWACLFSFNNKKPQSYIFGNCKGLFTPKWKWISLRLKEVPVNITPSFSQHRHRRDVIE